MLVLVVVCALGALPWAGCKQRSAAKARTSTSAVAAARVRPASSHRQRTLRFVSYNVLATREGVPLRVAPLLALLEQSKADVIALQEVAPWFYRALRRAAWTARYNFSHVAGAPPAPGGQLILARLPIRKSLVRLHPGAQRRTVVVSLLALPGDRTLAVATTHMESPLGAGRTRARQLHQIFALLRPYSHAVLLGDLNFGDGEQPETSSLDPSYRDAWRALRGNAPGYTWNRQRSPMADKGSFAGERSRRLDRLLFRGPGLRAVDVAIIGDRPIHAAHPSVFPSDHFGLKVTLQLRQRGAAAVGRDDKH